MNKEKLIEKMRQVSDAYVRDLIDEVPEAAHYLLMKDIAENMSISCAEAALKELDNEWVRVSEKLPELTEPLTWYDNKTGEREVLRENYKCIVLAYHPELGVYKAELNDTTGWSEKSSISSRGGITPTHWRNLPSPPKDK